MGSVASACCPNDTQPKMFRLWVIALLLLPSLASARVLPSSHRGERVKDSTFIPESINSNELQEFNGFMDSNDSFESDESPEYSSSESGESESTTMLPISPPEEDQEMRFRYALSQVLLPPPKPKEQPGSSKLNLPPAVQQERASMLLHGETSFQPYANLDGEDQLDEGEDLDEVDEVEDLEGSVDELPELAAWERYRGPNKLDLEGEENLEDYEDYQYKEDEDDTENGREIVKDKWLSEEGGNEEVDGGEWQEDEEEDEEDDLEQNDEEEWLPELSAGVKYRGPSIMVDLVEGQVPK